MAMQLQDGVGVHLLHSIAIILAHRLAGTVETDGLVLPAVDLHDGVKDFSDSVSPVVQDTLMKARNGGRSHCERTFI